MCNVGTFLEQVQSVEKINLIPYINEMIPQAGQVFVGCGEYQKAGNDKRGFLILNNKATKKKFGQSFTSVTQLLIQPPSGLFNDWDLDTEKPVPPQNALQQMTLVVEDAGPDSVFGLLLLLARLSNIDIKIIPQIDAWMKAVDDWERGGNAKDPWTSWCALESSLVHSCFPIGESPGKIHYEKAWIDGLHFAAACLAHDYDPNSLPELPGVRGWKTAIAAMKQELQVYNDWIPHADTIQLSIPIRGRNHRRLLVDAILFTEDQSTGAAKVLYRNDREHSPLHEGYSFAASYRPNERGTGNDITIAVDERLSLHLGELHDELEHRENLAWHADGQKRPSDNPRFETNIYNEPWFITPDGTLIGAPRNVKTIDSSGNEIIQHGTRLSWGGIRKAIWKVYNPLRDINVYPVDGNELIPLQQLQPVNTTNHAKNIILAKWNNDSVRTGTKSACALPTACIIPRLIAALTIKDKKIAEIRLEDLPTEGTYDQVKLSGGFAIVTARGLFVLDDWRGQELALDEIRKEADRIATFDAEIQGLTETVKDLAIKLEERTNAGKISGKTHMTIQKAAKTRAELASIRTAYAILPKDADILTLRDALEKRWSVQRRCDVLETEIRGIEEALRSLIDSDTAWKIDMVTIFGFPIFVAIYLAPMIGDVIFRLYSGSITSTPPGWLQLLCTVFMGILFCLLMRSFFNRKRADIADTTS